MNEINPQRKQLLYYAMVALTVILLFNILVKPMLMRAAVNVVDYNTFMTMTESSQVKEVEIRTDQILFIGTDDKIYATGPVNDPELVTRLHSMNIQFGTDIQEQMSPLMSFLLSWIIPMALFGAMGVYLNRRLMDKAGGGAGSMMFGMGKSNARVYVKSTEGIRFSDVAGEEEAK